MIFVKEKFRITGRGIIVLLKHQENGLAGGQVLVSEVSQKEWSIEARVLYDHALALDMHKIFSNEVMEYVRVSFKGEDKRKEAINAIKLDEDNNIYTYMIKPMQHDSTPEIGEKLVMRPFKAVSI